MSKFTCCCLPQSYLTVWSAWHSNLWICLLQTMCLWQHGLGCLFSVRSKTSHNDSSEKKSVWKKCEGCIVGNAFCSVADSTADKLQRMYFVCIILICKLLCIKVSNKWINVKCRWLYIYIFNSVVQVNMKGFATHFIP